jgi:hypothetical protein
MQLEEKTMTKQKRTRMQVTGLVSITLIIAAVSYGFASANVDTPGIGGLFSAGYGVISPTEVAKISYILDEDQPTYFVAVKFYADGIDSAPQVGVSETKDGEVVWADGCEEYGAFWKCSFDSHISVLEADWLFVEPD